MSQDELERAVKVIEAEKDGLDYQPVAKRARNGQDFHCRCRHAKPCGCGTKNVHCELAEQGINIHVISTSEIKISVLIDADYVEPAVRALHAAYGLDEEAAG